MYWNSPCPWLFPFGPRQANLVLIAYASSEGSGEPAQSRQNLRCSLIQAVSQEEPSDRKPDPWPFWMAGHAQLKFVMTECSKPQIRLTRPILLMIRPKQKCGSGNPTDTIFLYGPANFLLKNPCFLFLYVFNKSPSCFILHIYTILRLIFLKQMQIIHNYSFTIIHILNCKNNAPFFK